MRIFIDESGTPHGIKQQPFFVLAAVIIDDKISSRQINNSIANLLSTTRQKPEFRFSGCRDNMRDLFFKEVMQYNFRISVLVVDKRSLDDVYLDMKSQDLRKYFLLQLLKFSSVENVQIYIDGKEGEVFTKQVTSYLRQGSNISIKKLQFKNSQKDKGIQLADMVVGAIARSYYPSKPNHDRWRNMLKLNDDDIYEL